MGALFTRFFADPFDIKGDDRLKLLKLRVIRVINNWSKIAPYHLTDIVKNALFKFISFVKNDETIVRYIPLLEKSLHQEVTSYVCQQIPPVPIVPKTPDSQWTLLNLSPIEVARQMTLIHYSSYTGISPAEVLSVICASKNSQHLNELIDRFNLESGYITKSILDGDSPQRRAKIYMHWIEVAEELLKNQNYHGIFTVMSGLKHQSIIRMKETMKVISKATCVRKSVIEKLMNLTEISNDFGNYRKELETKGQPAIPFIGCLQRDLVYIQESFPTRINDLINIKKLQHCDEVISKVTLFQGIGYPFIHLPQVQEILLNLPPPLELFDLMRLSQSKEPINH